MVSRTRFYLLAPLFVVKASFLTVSTTTGFVALNLMVKIFFQLSALIHGRRTYCIFMQ